MYVLFPGPQNTLTHQSRVLRHLLNPDLSAYFFQRIMTTMMTMMMRWWC